MKRKHFSLSLALGLCLILTGPDGYAFHRSSSQAGQSLQPVAINTSVPQGAPITIEDVQATPTPLGSAGINYKITNNSTLRLIAIEITWNLKFASGTPQQLVTRKSYFFSLASDLAPGATDQLTMGAIKDAGSGVTWDPLQEATATVTYVEFANGTEFGSDARTAGRWFAGERADALNYYKLAFAAYQNGGETALAQAMSWKNEPATDSGRGAWLTLHQIKEKQGYSGLIAELTRLAGLNPPNE